MTAWIVCGILAAAAAGLLIKVIVMKKSADELSDAFSCRLDSDSGSMIRISSSDKSMRRLAARMNDELGELNEKRRKYINGDRELTEAITNVSHDIRTPLTAVCGYVELCEREEMSDTLRSYLSHIRSGTEALTSLSEELLGYSTAVSEKKLDPQITDIRALLEESMISFAGQLEKRGITPEISLPEAPLYRTVDRYAVSRVFGNIISNAVKYSDGDLSVLLTADGTASFSNTSSDLSEVDTAKLFNRFFTVDTARRSTGLGLSIAKLLTERSGGSISASYADGRLTITVAFKNSQPI